MPISETDIGKSQVWLTRLRLPWELGQGCSSQSIWLLEEGALEPHQVSERREAMGVGRHPAVQATEKEKENRGLELQRDRQ